MEIGIFVGTMYGNALLVAEKAQTSIVQKYKAIIYENPSLDNWEKYKNKYVLIVTSTTGNGDLPDNILPLYQDIKKSINYQSKISYGIIALGDSTHTFFCNGGKKFDSLLKERKAKRIGEILLIDAVKQQQSDIKFNSWIKNWITLLN